MKTDTDQHWIAVDMFTGEIITDNKPQRAIAVHHEIFTALASVCKMIPRRREDGSYDWRGLTKTERGMLNRAAKELAHLMEPPGKDEVESFGRWFMKNDFRGKRGDPPLPTDVVKMFTRFRSSRELNGEDIAKSWQRWLKR